MSTFFSLFSSPPYIRSPQGIESWVGVIIFIGLNLLLLWKSRGLNTRLSGKWLLLFILLIAAPITSLFIGVRLPPSAALTLPDLPVDPAGQSILVFSALPWVLAAGALGPAPAALVALVSGLARASWDTYNISPLLDLVTLAVIMGALAQQRYRTLAFRLLRRPLLLSIFLAIIIFPLMHLASILICTPGAFVERLDYALTTMQDHMLASGIELAVAGLFAEVLLFALPGSWGARQPTLPSPAEKSLLTRFLVSMTPLGLLLFASLMVGDWIFVSRAARSMLQAQMANAAAMTAENVPYFLETGQNIILRLAADPRLRTTDKAIATEALLQDLQSVPFFTQLIAYDETGHIISSYPNSDFTGAQAPVDEQIGIQMALEGMPFQTFTVPPAEGKNAAQISFVASILDQDQHSMGVLVGRTDLSANPFTRPMIVSLNSVAENTGQGMLLDENNRILLHPNPTMLMTIYTGRTSQEAIFYDDTSPEGTRNLVQYQPAKGRPWGIVLVVPAARAQQAAMGIAWPLFVVVLLLTLLAVFAIRHGLRSVTASLQNLASEAGRIAQGQLDHPMLVSGEDEPSQLRRAFEQMRSSLKARLDELNRLLIVSQGVASSLEISEAVQPILDAALASGASAARVVLTPAAVPDLAGDSSTPISFGSGALQYPFHELDEQVLALTRQQDRLVLANLSRPRLINLPPGVPKPEALIAIALRHENQYYGALYVTYAQTRTFPEDEVRFLVTLGSQAALAAANARLFLSAEVGRQRLAAILASSPDPVLVTDQEHRLQLSNPAAWQALAFGADTGEGQPIEQVISNNELIDLLHASTARGESREVTLADGRVYLATATPVLTDGQTMGRVCVLRDVTRFKELDSLKSDFVSTVSHDLRSPLTLMRGYATMLEMVGQLNEQQTSYVRKIVSGVESMARLVNNLLDLGRIEAGVGLQLEMIPVQDVVERVVGALQLQAAQKRIQLTSEIAQQTNPLIEADQALLQQGLQNLVENAIKYTRPEGKVHLRVRSQAAGTIFEVIDNGVGISPMDQPHLFEKFFRGAQQASKEQHGTGLGLAIVKSIAERHGGRVWAESQLGKGSTFILAVPARQPK